MLMKSDAMRKDDPYRPVSWRCCRLPAYHPRLLEYRFRRRVIGTLSGFTVWQTAFLATALYTGSAQFCFTRSGLRGRNGFGGAERVPGELRYLLMSSAMSVFFREQTTLQKIVSGLLLTDETFGVAVQRGGHQERCRCLDVWA
jgi:hypothetical protein